MLDHPLPDVEAWVLLFSNNSLPILRATQRRLEEMRSHQDSVDARELSLLVIHDPLMTARVFSLAQSLGSRSLQRDITTVASAVMMIGIEPFFKRFDSLPTIEGMLKGEDRHALLGILHIIRRAQRAADYAQEWAIWRNDVNMEEVRNAALLHDLAELLVWTFAPSLGLEIHAQQLAHPGLRSSDAQCNTLGFTFQDIQEALIKVWHLPTLLQNLISEAQPSIRERNVALAVQLARHSANGWDNPALPDDYIEIGKLLNLSPEAVRQRLGVDPMPARDADGVDLAS